MSLRLPLREAEALAEEPAVAAAVLAEHRERWWTPEAELLAALVEMTHANYRQLLAMSGAKKREIPKPLTVPRPATHRPAKKKAVASGRELAAWMAGRRR